MSRPAGVRRAPVGLACALAFLVVACGGGSEPEESEAGLTDVTSVLELRGAFNEDEGVPRLILILSPT